MDEKSKAKLAEIVKKEIAALTVNDKLFLKSRKSYLTAQQKQKFQAVLSANINKPTPTDDSDLNKLSYKSLQTRAKEYGLQYTGVKKEKLIEEIQTIEGPAYPQEKKLE